MQTEQKRFLYKEQIGSAVINFVLNGIIAWFVFKSLSVIHLWGWHQSIAMDLSITGLILGFLICVIVTPLSPKKMAKEGIPGLDIKDGGFAARLPRGLFARSLTVGLVGLIIAWLCIAALAVTGMASLSSQVYVVIKAVAAAVLALGCNYMTLMKLFTEIQEVSAAEPV